MANDKTNEPITTPMPNESGIEMARRTPGKGAGNAIGDLPGLIGDVIGGISAARQYDDFKRDLTREAPDVIKNLETASRSSDPHAGVVVTFRKDRFGDIHIDSKPANNPEEGLRKTEQVLAPGEKHVRIWIPADVTQNSWIDIPGYSDVMTRGEFFRFADRHRADAGMDSPALAGNTNASQVLAGLNISYTDRKQFAQQGQAQADAAALVAKPVEPKASQEAPALEAPSRKVI